MALTSLRLSYAGQTQVAEEGLPIGSHRMHCSFMFKVADRRLPDPGGLLMVDCSGVDTL